METLGYKDYNMGITKGEASEKITQLKRDKYAKRKSNE